MLAFIFGSPVEIVSHFIASAAFICRSADFKVALFSCAKLIASSKLKSNF
jgi:hypothetical protein